MSRTEKRQFVRDLIKAVQKTILDRVADMPENWDGHELRRYVADRFDDAAMTVGRRGPYGRAYRARTRAYRNDVITRNL